MSNVCFISKIKNLKEKLKVWNKEVFGNVQIFVQDAEKKLTDIQDDIDKNGATNSLLNMQKQAQNDLQKALETEELF